MDVRYINPFCQSVTQLFKTMLDADVILGRPTISHGDVAADASAIIGFSGDAVGCVVLCFPMDTAVRTASEFAGVELHKDHEDFSDALGELANIVAGQAKAKLEGMNINISLPCVIIGRQYVVSRSKLSPRLILPCESRFGRFTVEVAMETTKASKASEPTLVAAAR